MQGEFTKDEVIQTIDQVDEMFKALSKNKQDEYLGHLKDIWLFLEAAKKAAPDKPGD